MKLIAILLFAYLYHIKSVSNFNMSLFIKDTTFETKISHFFSRLLHKYRNFEIIFHTETATVKNVDIVIAYFTYKASKTYNTSSTSFMVYNHDKLSKHNEFSRPQVSNVANILLSNHSNFWNSLSHPDKINYNDVVIFIGNKESVRDKVLKWGVTFVKLAGKVLLVEITKHLHHGLIMYDTCYYCGSKSLKFDYVEKSHNSKLHTEKERLMPSKFKNLNGHLFHIVFISYFPFVSCEESSIFVENGSRTCAHIRGIESKMMEAMSKALNFTYKVHIMHANASFFDIITYINNESADIGIGGISMTADRIPLVQFTKQYNTEDFTFLYLSQITLKEVFVKFMEPFTAVLVWTLYAIIFLLLTILLYAALIIKTRKQHSEITIYESMWVLIQIMFEQSNPSIRSIFRSRLSTAMCLAFWWWVCIILNTVYKSTMLSTVVNPPTMEPENLEQLVNADYKFVGNIQFSDIIRDLLLVQDPLYIETLSKIKYGKDTCNVFEQILNGHVAMLDELSTIQFEIRNACPVPNHKKMKWLRIGRKAIRSTGHAWATQRGAPFRPAVDHFLNLVLSGGHFKKWTKDVTSYLEGNLIPMSREAKYKSIRRLSLKRFSPVIALYSIGVLIATICFIGEISTLYFINTQHR